MRCSARVLVLPGLTVLLALGSLGCGGDQGAAAPGAFDVYVPSATPVVRVLAEAAPRRAIPLIESHSVVLGPTVTGQPNQFQIATGDDGRVVALDVYDGGLRTFNPDGAPESWAHISAPVLTFERPPLTIGTAGDQVILSNAYPGQLLLVEATGEVVADREQPTSPWKPTGLHDGTFVALQLETGVVGRYALDGSEIARYTVFQFPEEKLGGETRLWPHHDFAVGQRRVYVTTAESHQVTAFDVDGASAWVLEGDSARIPIPENISGKTLGRSRRAGRAAGATIDTEYTQVKWPEFYPALARIATDGDDRLYVFPYVVEANPDRYPVDVYDADGTPIVQGWLPFQGWDAFSGDAVFRIETRNGQTVAVRYQLDLAAAGRGLAAGQ